MVTITKVEASISLLQHEPDDLKDSNGAALADEIYQRLAKLPPPGPWKPRQQDGD